MKKYREAVSFIESFSNTSIRKNFGKDKRDPRFFLDRTRYFLDLLGNPGKDISYIHVTGTAGKGTVSTMLANILTVSGKKTGLFTSPYVTTTIEKIAIDGIYISPTEFIRLVDYLKPFIEKAKKGPYGAPSAFELFLAISFLFFQKQKCEWVILEVGLGGRYDATNIIEKPVVTAITMIDYDHTEVLGKTLKEIATDKAGIIKPGCAFFTSEQRPTLQKLFKNICAEKGVPFNAVPKQLDHSAYNRELVTAIGKHLRIPDKSIHRGISNTKLPCRFETIQKKPTVILDGAHNRAKIRSTISSLKKLSFEKLFLIVSVADNKNDNRRILKDLLAMPYSMSLTLTQVQSPERRSLHPNKLLTYAKKFQRKNASIEVDGNAHLALKSALKEAAANDVILVTGSFFLAGELRKEWVSEEEVLEARAAFPEC